MFLHKYPQEKQTFALENKKGKSEIIIIVNTHFCCYTCYFFNFVDYCIKFEKPCEGFPEKLPVNNEVIQIYTCEKYEPIKIEKINL